MSIAPLPSPLRVGPPPCLLRVLVIDDNADAAETLALLLTCWGYQTAITHDGPTALAAAPAFRPDVVLLDIGLPGMDGYEVARRLRELPGLATALLVAISGHGGAEVQRRAREAGIDHYLVKPAMPDLLQRLLRDHAPRREMVA